MLGAINAVILYMGAEYDSDQLLHEDISDRECIVFTKVKVMKRGHDPSSDTRRGRGGEAAREERVSTKCCSSNMFLCNQSRHFRWFEFLREDVELL